MKEIIVMFLFLGSETNVPTFSYWQMNVTSVFLKIKIIIWAYNWRLKQIYILL